MPPTATTTATETGALSIETLLEHSDWVRRLARGLAGDEHRAEDLVQQTWLAAMRNPPTERSTLRGWLATVVRNLARDRWRRDGRRERYERLAARPAWVAPTDALAVRADAHRRLIEAVLALPESFRTAVLLRFFEGLTPTEIAERTGVPAGTVRSRLHRGLRALRGRLEAEDGPGVWRLALLPLPAASRRLQALRLMGGILVTTKQKVAVGALLLLLACGGAWYATTLAPPAAPPPETAAEVAAAAPGHARKRAEPEKPSAEPAPPGDPPEAPTAEPAAPPAPPPPTHTRVAYELLGRLQPRPVPRGLKELREHEEPEIALDVEAGGGRGMMVPLNVWRRWAPAPEKGSVTFRGRVTDAAGVPVPHAQVYRVDVTKPGGAADPVSFQWVKEIARTDAEGHFEAAGQPARSFALAANYEMIMNGPRGLRLEGSAVPVDPAEQDVLSGLVIQLPFELSKLGDLEGRVLDADGNPLPTIAEIWRGRYHRVRTTRDGSFVMKALPEGDVELRIDSTGFAEKVETLRVVGGTTKTVEVRLELAEQGPLELRGRVEDEDRAPVANAPVFLAASFAGSRWTRTDDAGRFVFAGLPTTYAKRAVSVMVSPIPERDRVLGNVVENVRAGDRDVVIRVRRTGELRLLLRDRETGAPLPQYDVKVRSVTVRDGETHERTIGGTNRYDETGSPTFWVPTGRILIDVRAKGHDGVAIAIDVSDTTTPREILVELERTLE